MSSVFENLFNFKSGLIRQLPEVRGKYLENVKLSRHTWFGVGGPAEVLFLPYDETDLRDFLIKKPASVPVTVIGGGSNLLVRDGGIPGVVIKLDGGIWRKIEFKGTEVTVGSGVQNGMLKKGMLENGIGGLEFLCSIPGRVGGLLRTNAGCFGKAVSDVFVKARVMDEWGKIRETEAADFNFGYRSSLFPEDWIILDATFRGMEATPKDIKNVLEGQAEYRRQHQPYNAKTAGSTFKNPEGLAAWKLIKEAGCDKLKIGGAEVSDKHCNFLINTGTATALDIETLGETIIEKVREKTAITLEWEVRRIGVKK